VFRERSADEEYWQLKMEEVPA